MHFLHIDETGSPEKNDQTPLFCMVGISTHKLAWRKFATDFFELKKTSYPEFYQRSNRDPGVFKREEEKIKTLLKPSNKGNRRDSRFVHNILNLLFQYDSKIFPIVILKDQLKREPKAQWLYPLCLQRLVVKFQRYLQEKDAYGVMVLDSRNEVMDDILAAQHLGYIFGNRIGRVCDKVMGIPLFARSHLSFELQIADICSYIVYGRYYSNYYSKRAGATDYRYLDPFWSRIKNILYHFPSSQTPGIIV